MGESSTALTAAQAGFVEGPRSIYAASRDAALRPSLSRVAACRVSADRRSLLLLMHPLQAVRVLADVAETGELAVVFSAPESNETLQLKGRARIVSAPADAEALVQGHLAGFVDILMPMRFTPPLVHTIVRGTPEALLALEFLTQSVYEQTPGPRAGERIEAAP